VAWKPLLQEVPGGEIPTPRIGARQERSPLMDYLASARDLAQFHAESRERPPCPPELALRSDATRRLESLVERYQESTGRVETTLQNLLEELVELRDEIEGGM
jgi:hypothetical protein